MRPEVRYRNGPGAHELGHAWFGAVFQWPQPPPDAPAFYGEWGAPDWLDEAAATLAEQVPGRERKRDNLCSRYPQEEREQFLAQWLETEHPSVTASVTLARDGKQGLSVKSDAERMAMLSDEKFAHHPRVLFDELVVAMVHLVKARHPPENPPWGDLAGTIVADGSLKQWLSSSGEQHGLPATVEGFLSAFNNWILDDCALR